MVVNSCEGIINLADDNGRTAGVSWSLAGTLWVEPVPISTWKLLYYNLYTGGRHLPFSNLPMTD